MRVIAGSARRLLLKTPAGMETRPTSDQIKETLFNILMPYLYGCDFLDLFAGSGGIGIEALSRGANRAVLVENSKAACTCIESNITTTHFNDKCQLMKCDVMSALRTLEGRNHFDIVFMDPPYGYDHEKSVLSYLCSSSLIDRDSMIIVEALADTDFSYLDELGFKIDRIKQYKSNMHVFISLQ